jgi:type II secretory pathway predicted ATPase ExeA
VVISKVWKLINKNTDIRNEMTLENIPREVRDSILLEDLNPGYHETLLEVRNKIHDKLKKDFFPHYTDHSIKHCDRIVIILSKIIEESKHLKRNERMLLFLSAYLHDLAMSMPYIYGIKNLPPSPNQLESMRKDHGRKIASWLIASYNDNKCSEDIGIMSKEIKPFLPILADVCAVHQSLEEYDVETTETLMGENVRIGILQALLRIADSLDTDIQRIDVDILDQYELAPESLAHWLSCYYIDSVKIEKGLIEIHTSLPATKIPPEEIALMNNFISDKVKIELKEHPRKFLWKNGIRISPPEVVQTTNKSLLEAKRQIPDKVIDYLKSIYRTIDTEKIAVEQDSEKDYLGYWKFIGNPFNDFPLPTGSTLLVETHQYQTWFSEIRHSLEGGGGFKLLAGQRGLGKTTFFLYLKSKLSDNYDIILIDVAKILPETRTADDLYRLVIGSIDVKMKETTNPQNDKIKKKQIICVDSLDRINHPNRVNKETQDIIEQFFKFAQARFSELRQSSYVIVSCANEWIPFLSNQEFSYLQTKNYWEVECFNVKNIKEILRKRFKESGRKLEDIIDDECIAALWTMSMGNPRNVLTDCESIFIHAAEKKKNRITLDFIKKEYEGDYAIVLKELITKLCKESPDFASGIESLYLYFCELERRSLDRIEGSHFLEFLVETNLKRTEIETRYLPALRYVADENRSFLPAGGFGESTYKAKNQIRKIFKILKKEGYDPRSFISLYSTDPLRPPDLSDDKIKTLTNPLLTGEYVAYLQKARDEYIRISQTKLFPHILIRNCWDVTENLIVAYLSKIEKIRVYDWELRKKDYTYVDQLNREKYVKGVGQLMATDSNWLLKVFSDYLREKKIWMKSLQDIRWLLNIRNNILKGRTDYYTQYGEKEATLAIKHLEIIFKELSALM